MTSPASEDIEKVILVGGSSRIPKVRDILETKFPGIELLDTLNADEAIATGAAFMAALQSEDCVVD